MQTPVRSETQRNPEGLELWAGSDNANQPLMNAGPLLWENNPKAEFNGNETPGEQ